MAVSRNKNSFQGPKLDDYISKIVFSEKHFNTKLNIPKNIKDRITWQQFEDDIINTYINEYIVRDGSQLKTQFPNGLESIRDQVSDTSDFFNGKLFAGEWNEIAFKIWDEHKNNYLAVLTFIDNLSNNSAPNKQVLSEKYHYLSTKSQTLIPLKDFLSKRKPIHIKKRWLNVLDPYLKKGKWSEEEDALLIEKYNHYGPHWSKIAMEIPRRTVDQCSKRFHEALDPDKSTKNHVDWSLEEDFLLINTLKEFGSKWRTIAMKLNSNRSALNCRNRWRKIINSYIKGKCNLEVVNLINKLSKDEDFEDITKLREELELKEIERVERKLKKAKHRSKTDYKQTASTGSRKDESDDNSEAEEEDEDEEDGYDIEDEDGGNTGEFSDVDHQYAKSYKDIEGLKNVVNNFTVNKLNSEQDNGLSTHNILLGDSIHRPEPSLVSNFLEQQFDQQQLTGNQHMQALSPGPYHMSMSPPANLSLGLMQTPKPHDILSSLRTTQISLPQVNPQILGNHNNILNNIPNHTTSPISNTTNKFHKNTPIQSVRSSTSLNKTARPNSVPLKSNSTEWKFQLKQKNLTLSSGNITSERLVSLLIEQAKLNNLKISIHQHIHNHYMPVLDHSENGSSITTTPGSEQNANTGSKNQVSVASNNSSAPSVKNANGSFGTKVIKDLNEIGAYRVRHFKQLDVKKVPKLASSSGSGTKRMHRSNSGSSPVNQGRKRVKFNNTGSVNTNSGTNTGNNSARSSIAGSNEYENNDESFDFWDSLMQSNPLSHIKQTKGAKPDTKESTKDVPESKPNSSRCNSNELEYYMLGFNPS